MKLLNLLSLLILTFLIGCNQSSPVSSSQETALVFSDYGVFQSKITFKNSYNTKTRIDSCVANGDGSSVCTQFINGQAQYTAQMTSDGKMTSAQYYVPSTFNATLNPALSTIGNTFILNTKYNTSTTITYTDVNGNLIGNVNMAVTSTVQKSTYNNYSDCITLITSMVMTANGKTTQSDGTDTYCKGIGEVKSTDATDTWIRQ